MAVYTQVSAEALAGFLVGFDVGELVSAKGIAEGVENSNYLVDTTGGRFILTLYEKRVDAADMPFFPAWTYHLAGRDKPVPRMIADRSGAWLHELEGRPACLIEFLPGVSLSHPTPAKARAAGAAMAQMHASLADFAPTRPNSMGAATWRPLFERCGRDLDGIATGLHDDIGAALDEVLGDWTDTGVPVGAIHADLFPDNVLMQGERVAGIIDFYFACTDVRGYDLAVMHTAWSFDADGTAFDPAVGRALVAGYESVLPLSATERGAFDTWAKGACLRFLLSRAWDWLHTPADALVTRKDPLAYWRRYQAYADGRASIAA